MLDTFRSLYGSADAAAVYRAPGRVNLIGEHTDYTFGFVLPVALDLATQVAVAPSPDKTFRIYSEERREMREFPMETLPGSRPAHHWSDYPIGVALQLIQAGFPIAPANLLIRSTVPEGSGLSSSAALEVASALALLNGRTIEPLQLALLCQRAEREFVGVPCGIMDQYISVFGRRNSAVEIDCRSLGNRLVPLPESVTFMAVNSMVKHALGSSAYKTRVAECAAAADALGSALRDMTPAEFELQAHLLADPIVRRARHVITENARVANFVDASQFGDTGQMGRLMVESHRSLQHDYEVSCPELDFLVDTALSIEGVYGSRMTGGGFGGCTVTMLRPDAVEGFEREMVTAYQSKFQITPQLYPVRPSDGAGMLRAS
jgi:galactokinase